MRLALYQPDIAQNAGTLLRMGACLGFGVDIIEPAGFRMTDAALRRAGMDYLDVGEWRRHVSWQAFDADRRGAGRRLILLSRHSATAYGSLAFDDRDTLLVGRESAGVPECVVDAADVCATIPMRPDMRSLNVAVAAAMVVGEAFRQLGWPDGTPGLAQGNGAAG